MKQLLIFIGLITICYSFSYSQIYSNTKRVRISNAKEMPPDLRAKFSFEDYNGNNILEALETSKITIIITNIGKGVAENLFITVKDNLRDDNLLIADKMHIAKLYPAQTDTVHINISSTANIKTDKHRLVISVSEENGYDMDPVSLTLTTIEYQKPKLKLVGLKIDENSENSYIKNYDGKVEKGERVKVIMTIQNIGNNIAHDLDFKVTTNDINIKILNATSHAKVLKVGEVQEVAFSLILNNKIKAVGNLPIFLNATVRHNY